MIDTDLKTWLIEINRTPAMDLSTSVTAELVPKFQREMVKIVIDGDE